MCHACGPFQALSLLARSSLELYCARGIPPLRLCTGSSAGSAADMALWVAGGMADIPPCAGMACAGFP